MPPAIHSRMTVSAVGTSARRPRPRPPGAASPPQARTASPRCARRRGSPVVVSARHVSESPSGTPAASRCSRADPRRRLPCGVAPSSSSAQRTAPLRVGGRASARSNTRVDRAASVVSGRICSQALGAAVQRRRERRAVRQLERLQRRGGGCVRVVTTCSRFGRPSAVISGSASTSAARARLGTGAACALTSVTSTFAACFACQTPVIALTRVHELLGRQPPHARAAEHVRLRAAPGTSTA